MDRVSQWFPPLTNREVQTILLGDTVWRVTVRDQSGLDSVGVLRLVGLLPFPNRIEVQWQEGPLLLAPRR